MRFPNKPIPTFSTCVVIFSFFLLFPIKVTCALAQELPTDFPLHRIYQHGTDYQGTPFAYAITEDKYGSILFGNDNIGIQHINGTQSYAIPLPFNMVAAAFATDKNGRIYTSSSSVLGFLKRTSNEPYTFESLASLISDSAQVIPFLHDIELFPDSENVVFISLERAYIYHKEEHNITELNPQGAFFDVQTFGSKTYLTDTQAGLFELSVSGNLRHVSTPFKAGENRLISLQNELFLYTEMHELWHYSSDSIWIKQADFTFFINKPKNEILSISALQEGSIVFTSLAGVHIFDKKGHLLETYSDSDLLPSSVAGFAYEAKNGTLWISTPNGLVSIERKKDLRQFVASQGVPEKGIRTVSSLGDLILLGTESGLYLGKNNQFKKNLDSVAIFSFLPIKRGVLAGTSKGLYIITRSEKVHKLSDDMFVQFMFTEPQNEDVVYYYDSPNALKRADIISDTKATHTELFKTSLTPYTLTHDSLGNLWMGTRNLGLFQLITERATNRVQKITSHKVWDTQSGLPSELNNVTIFLENDVRFLTNKGLYKLSVNRDSIVADTSHSINKAGKSFGYWPFVHQGDTIIYTSSAAGIDGKFSVNPRSKSLSWDNLPAARIKPFGNLISIHVSQIGNIFIATPSNLFYVKKDSISEKKFEKPLMLLTHLSAEPDSSLFSGWESSFSSAKIIDYEWNSLRFKWSLISFYPNSFNRYRFRLKGATIRWSDWSDETYADFRTLREGTYQFEVIGKDLLGNESSVIRYPFTIQPPWYRSIWAYLFYGFSFLLLIGFVIRWRTSYYVKKQVELESQIHIRTRELAKKNRELELVNQVKTKFYSNISHEFRTPLTLIKGPALLLQQDLAESNSKSSTNIEAIIANSDRLQVMIEDMLTISKMETGEFELHIQRFDLSSLLSKIRDSFYPLAEQKKLKLQIHIDLKSPEFVIYADKKQLEILISNLVSNSIKYTLQGEINLTLCRNENNIFLSVEDTGIGISEKDLPHIFERYYRGQSTKLSHSGSGIGLNLVYLISELHGISLTYQSEIQKGTKVSLDIPGTLEALQGKYIIIENAESLLETWKDCSENLQVETLNQAISKETSISSLSEKDIPLILLVDDNEAIRDYIKSILSDSFQFVEYAQAKDALQLFDTLIPDLILSDVMMPGMDGFEFTKKIRENVLLKHIPILLITAKAGDLNELTGFQAGANDYILKPFSPEIVKARVWGHYQLLTNLRKFYLEESAKRDDNESAHNLEVNELTTIIERIQLYLSDPDFSVEHMAGVLNMSRTTLHRKMKKLAGLPTQEFIKKQRLEFSLNLLQQKKVSISEIAYAAGFRSVSYFSRAFKAEYGFNPSDI